VLGFEHGPIRAFSEVLYTAPLHPSPEEVLSCMVATLFSAPRLRHAEEPPLCFEAASLAMHVGSFAWLRGSHVLEVFRRGT